MVDSCWRVCKASRFAPSSFESASVRAAEPFCSVLIVALVKSWRICTVDRFELKVCDCERSVVSAAVRRSVAASMFALVAQLPAAFDAQRARIGVGVVHAVMVVRRRGVFVEVHRQRVAAEQVDAVEAGVAGELADLGQQGVELRRQGRLRRGVGGLLAWLTSDWADCTSLVIAVMPLFAA